jgi:hypothetical protein
MDMTTKKAVRSDWAYARELMRQADRALRTDDFDTLAEIAPDLRAASCTLLQYLDDRGICV